VEAAVSSSAEHAADTNANTDSNAIIERDLILVYPPRNEC
jgi:hypothetical protein